LIIQDAFFLQKKGRRPPLAPKSSRTVQLSGTLRSCPLPHCLGAKGIISCCAPKTPLVTSSEAVFPRLLHRLQMRPATLNRCVSCRKSRYRTQSGFRLGSRTFLPAQKRAQYRPFS